MELALAVPVGTAQTDAQAQMVAASAACGEDVSCNSGDAPPVADESGWITAASLRAQRAARRSGVGLSADVITRTDQPTQAEILFSSDISTGIAACPLDPAAAAAAAAELLEMGFGSDQVKVFARHTQMNYFT
jgi:hypothetical protein